MTGADLIALLKKHPISSVCGLICLLCGVAYYFRGDKVDLLTQELDAKVKESQGISANIRNAAGLPQQAAEIQEAAKQLNDRLIKPSQLAINQQFFYRLENDTAVKLIDIRQGNVPAPRPGAPKANYVAVPFSLSLQGSFKQVTDFVQRLERSPHFCRFLNLSMTKVGGSAEGATGGVTGLMSVTMSIEVLGTP